MSKRNFLRSILMLFAQGAQSQKSRRLLQLTVYERMPESALKPFFDAIDRQYTPRMAKAPGLISYERYVHYDLPEKVSIEIWESEAAAKAWYEGDTARALWDAAMKTLPKGVPAEYRVPMHSMVHRHYFLEQSFR